MSQVRMEKKPYMAAAFGEKSPLPDLHNVSYVHSQVTWDDSLSGEDVKYYRYGRVGSILPYADQNGYTREKKETTLDTVILENERVKAEFLPWMGGRLWSLEVDGKEILSRNPVVQPCNLALRNAWCSGGVEWNVSVRGHNMLTCEDLFTELIRLEDGTAGVRFYEYERIRGIVYRIEAYLPEKSPFLYVQAHIENPAGNGEKPMYWWSNIAVPEEEGTRVVTPAETAVISLYGAGQYRMSRRSLPMFEGMDLSRPCDIDYSLDVFYDLPEGERPYIAALGKDGSGLVQCSTARQLGRKLFVWGMGNGGRHWQQFLSDGKTSYIEIQAGIARTQQDHIPMPDGATWEWLEAYGRMTCDVDGLDFAGAREACGKALEVMLPRETLEGEFAGRGKEIAHARGEIVRAGSGWGALANEQRRKADLGPVSGVCVFPENSVGSLQQPWQRLLREGVMEDRAGFPDSCMIGEDWKRMLENAPRNALTAYQLGIVCHSEGKTEEAREYFTESLSMREDAPAHRAMARMEALDGNAEACLTHYEKALALSHDLLPVRLEYAQTLSAFGRNGELDAYLHGLPEEIRTAPRFQYLQASADVALGRYEEALEIMLAPLVIPDMREGELSLSDLWFTLFMKKENLSREEAERLHPLPQELDFRMH